MYKKITDMKGLHGGLPFQKKLLLKNKTSPSRDLLAMKLLGVEDSVLKSFEQESGIGKAELINKRKPVEELAHVLRENRVYASEELPLDVDAFTPPVNENVTQLTMDWLKSITTHEKTNRQKIAYQLENSDDLEKVVKRVLNYEGKDDCLNLIVLFPISGFLGASEDNGIKLSWDICEQTYDDKTIPVENHIALLIALQILTLDKIDDKTCFDIVKNTVLRKYFDPINLSDKDGGNRRYYVTLKNAQAENLLYTTVARNSHGFIKKEFRNISRKKVETNKLINDEVVLRDIEKHEICDEDISGESVVITKRKKLKNEMCSAKYDKEFEAAAYGLRVIMSQTPGVLCNIKIPFNFDYIKKIRSTGRLPEESETWIFGPEYWIEFLENSSVKKGRKPGVDDRKLVIKYGNDESTEVVYDFGSCIHHMGYLTE